MSYQDFQTFLAPRIDDRNQALDKAPWLNSLKCDHILNEDAIEYFDGVFVAYCVICNDRVEFARIPGNSLPARAKALLRIVQSGKAESIHEMEFCVLKSFLKGDIQAVRETAAILEEIEEAL